MAQDTSKILRPEARYKHSLGGRRWGIGLGNNPAIYSGLKFNFRNENTITNGINLAFISSSDHIYPCRTNGINISLLFLEQKVLNGIGITPFWLSIDKKMNGIFATGFISDTDTLNGIGFTGLVHLSMNAINGISVAGIDVTSDRINGLALGGFVCIADKTHNGISLSGIFSKAETMNGLMASLVTKSGCTHGIQLGLVNTCTFMQGIQFGLINVIKQNPRWCRIMPFINFHVRKFVPRIDTVTDGNDLIVTRYQLDNHTLRSVETWSKSLFDSIRPFDSREIFYAKKSITEFQLNQTGPRHGKEISYDKEGRLLLEAVYADDTLQSKKSISYFDYNMQTTNYLHDSVTETWTLQGKDTTEYTRTVKGVQMIKTRKQEGYMGSEVYYYMEMQDGKTTKNVLIYNGEDIIEEHKELGQLRLLKGDTLQEGFDLFSSFDIGEDLWTDDMEPCFKNNIAYYTYGNGKLKGLGYTSKDSSVFKKIIYYDYKKNRIRSRTLYTKDKRTDTCYYRNGKVLSVENDSTAASFNKRGKMIGQSFYDEGFYKTYRKGRLRSSSGGNCVTSYYRNGRPERERSNWYNGTYTEQYYRKDGRLEKEIYYDNGTMTEKYYKKDGTLKEERRYEHGRLVSHIAS